MTRIGPSQLSFGVGQAPSSLGDLTAALDQRAASGWVLGGDEARSLVELARPLPPGELAALQQSVGQALEAPTGWKCDAEARQTFADFLGRPVDALPPAVQPSAEQLALTAQARVQANQATLEQLHALAPQPDATAGQQLGQQAKQPPAASYDGSKGGLLGLLEQTRQQAASGVSAPPFGEQELQDRLAAYQQQIAQSSGAAGSGDLAQATQDLQRVGAGLQQPDLAASQQALLEQFLELLIQLMMAFGMSAEQADSALGQALGSAGGWTGPKGGHASSAPRGRQAGGRWSNSSGGGSAPSTHQPENWKPVTDPAPAGYGVSTADLTRIVPGLAKTPDKAEAIAGNLNKAMHEAGITDRKEQAAFIAQLAHESGGFKYMEEIASGAAYEGRRDLGNTQPGDGRRFKGRGPIQLTGRANYREAGKALGLDLENNPQLAATPEVGFRTAAWYWKTRGCGAAARAGDFRAVTKKINGGYNGLADRTQYYNKALSVLGG